MSLQPAIFIYLGLISVLAEETPTVDTKYGKIVGETLKSNKGREYSAFAGIPFAKPPIGNLRFEPPEPIEPWQGVLKTSTQSSKRCAQANAPQSNKLLGDEDCLYLNVYIPKISDYTQASLPVMVWIHGGAFLWWSGTFEDFGPQRFMDRDIVLVTINYRLGFFGLLANPEDGLPGNNALLDQIAALKWVQENIEAFGGNKSRVTIFGESAGAVFVAQLILSPLTQGLFHAAIIQSGSAICNWALDHDPATLTKLLSLKLNCVTSPLESMIECFRNKTWQDITMNGIYLQLFPAFAAQPRPCIDGNIIVDKPQSTFQSGNFTKIPIMIGRNQNEGAWFWGLLRNWFPRIGENAIERDLHMILSSFTFTTDLSDELLDKIRKIYFTNVNVDDKTEFDSAVVKILGELAFSCTDRTARYFASASNQPTYHYKFTYRGANSVANNQPGEDLGVSHADELQYLFYNDLFPGNKRILNENDTEMSEIMLSLWTNFAYSHNPTPSDGQQGMKLPFTWTPYQKGTPKCLQLNLNPTISEKCESENTDFWMEELEPPVNNYN